MEGEDREGGREKQRGAERGRETDKGFEAGAPPLRKGFPPVV